MKAKIKETGEIIEVEHEDLGGRASDVSFWCSSHNRTYSYMELEFKDSYKVIDWEQRFYEVASNLYVHRKHHHFDRGLNALESIEMATIFINQLKQQSDENRD